MGVISYRNRNKGKVDKNGRPLKPRWEYRFSGPSIRGKRNVFSKSGFATKQEAVQAGTMAQNEYMRTGTVFQESQMSYSDCLDSWMENYVKIRCAPSTVRNYENYLERHIRPVLGRYRVGAIRHETVQNLINDMYNRHFARNTLVNMRALISGSMRYAKRQGWIQQNPAEDVILPFARNCTDLNQRSRDAISREDIRRIFERYPEGEPSHLSMMIAYHCGLRVGEAFGLTWEDIDLEEGVLTVAHQIQWQEKEHCWRMVPPKFGSARRVKMDSVILALLRRTREHQLKRKAHYGDWYTSNFLDENGFLNTEGKGRETGFVMLRDNGEYITPHTSHHASRTIREELGIERFDFHSLRHTHATELCENGVNIKEIQRRLGHKRIEITMRTYLHATATMEDASVEIMNRMYGAEK